MREINLLRQIGRPQPDAFPDDAGVRCFFPKEEFQQGCFAGAVCAQQRDTFPVADMK